MTTKNYQSHEDISGFERNAALAAAEHYINILRYHCGPYARYAAHVIKRASQAYTEFTKDGVSITAFMEEDDQQREMIRQLAKYVGTAVDSACKDGTTTSMMLFLMFLRSATKVFTTYGKQITPAMFDKIVANVIDMMEQRIDADKITVDGLSNDLGVSLAEAAEFVAFNQAMISSKGDTDLSLAIVECVKNTPPELWELFYLSKQQTESDERVIAYQWEEQQRIPGAVVDNTHLNSVFNTQYEGHGVDLYITANELVANSPETILLEQLFVGKDLEKDLVIISPGVPAKRLLDAASNHRYQTTSRGEVVIFVISSGLSGLSHYQAIITQCLADKPDPMTYIPTGDLSPAVIRDVVVKFKNNTISLDDLYFVDEGAVYHPSYLDDSANPRYTNLRFGMLSAINEWKSAIVRDKSTELKLEMMTHYYKQLTCVKQIELKVCGTLHDHMALYSVAQDAYGSVVSALTDGFVVGGHNRMRDVLLHWQTVEGGFTPNGVQSAVVGKFIEDLRELLEIIYYPPSQALIENRPVGLTYQPDHSLAKYQYLRLSPQADSLLMTVQEAQVAYDTVPNMAENGSYHLFQPYAGYEEFFRRLRELLTKYAMTSLTIDDTGSGLTMTETGVQ